MASTDEGSSLKLASSSPRNNHENNLPYFLTVLQQLGVDILPLTWQPALDSLGGGKYTIVNQSLVNVQMSFAFKRCRSDSMYEDLISEIVVLSQPSLYQHSNVNPLQGICFEIVVEPRSTIPEIKPVLVFPKASHGSLQKFLSGNSKGKLNLVQLHGICLDLAGAINLMHASGVPRIS
jgi:hypothetical protein